MVINFVLVKFILLDIFRVRGDIILTYPKKILLQYQDIHQQLQNDRYACDV
ncbi:hypothetical protein GLYMA_04G211450v4 [Glycine max]|nr:hypothetical protein GLYMA_04G211450v4 [Glycine max]KAH1112474.1 hypothetical protein GYH30_010641 [Glycine max]